MAKRKKKKPDVKQQQAQHRKAYLRKVMDITQLMGVEDFASWVEAPLLRSLFDCRTRSTAMVAASDDVSASVLKEARMLQDSYFNAYGVEVYQDGPEVSMRDYLTVVQSIYFFLTADPVASLDETLQGKFKDVIQWIAKDCAPYERLDDLLWFTALPLSDLARRLYWIQYKLVVEGGQIVNQFALHTVRPAQKKVCIDGKSRTVFRVGWAMPGSGPSWSEIDASLFDDPRARGLATLPVFVQSHTLHRMAERLDCTEPYSQQFNLFISLQQPVIVKGPTGQWLIEYQLKKHKLGYLLVDIVESILVVRTFLFVTMDSTPEGHALQEALGLAAVDKKYLAIDRLSTFLLSDIADHADIKAHFVKAGCEDLVSFDTSFQHPEQQWKVGQFIRSYLNTSEAETVERPAVLAQASE